jgi:TonB family protein
MAESDAAAAADAVAVPSDLEAPLQTARYRIVTKPPGAAILLEGEPLELVTPAEIELPGDARQLIQIDLEGYKTVRWTFAADRLSAVQRRTHTLYFPLVAVEAEAAPAPPPVRVAAAPGVAPARPVAPPALPTSPRGRIDRELSTVRGGKEGDMPKKVEDAEPVYARESVPTGRQPIVILELTLDPRGEVANAKVLRGLTPALDEAAKQATYAWRYEVTPHKGKPVNTVITTTVLFQEP